MIRDELDKRPGTVAAMFDAVAPGYDRTNRLISMGQERRWRRAVVHALDTRPGERLLDLAAGTGASTQPFADLGVRAVACDFSLGMLRAGRGDRPALGFVAGDATRLPFADASFDAVTISFGLRNVVDVDAALREMLRVTRIGGRLLICEFSRPLWAPWRAVYNGYSRYGLPLVARFASSSPDAYRYLVSSIQAWPDQPGLAAKITSAGWSDVRFRNLGGGIVALHRAVRR